MASLLARALGRTASSRAQVGVALCDAGYAIAVVQREPNAKPYVQHCALHSADGALTPHVKAALQKLGAARARACAVLGHQDYQIVQVEAPDVLPSEMRAAIRWRLRDAVSLHLEETVVDTFDMPDPARRTEAKMLFAVAARATAVQHLAATLRPAASAFYAIDVPELCLRNISAATPQDARGVAVAALHEHFVQLVITRQGVMYLSRRIDAARRFEPHASASGGGEGLNAAQLALELQRSLDYYEAQYDLPPIGDLIIAPAGERAHKLAEQLKQETSLRIAPLEPRDLFRMDRSGDIAADWPRLMALGAALRDDEARNA